MSSQPGPATVAFDPASGELPPSLRPDLTDPDSPVVLIVASAANEPAGRTAIGLAEAIGREMEDVVLVDGGVDAPRLHRLLDLPNLEGLVDIFLFGASLERVRTRPADRAFDFIPAGVYAPEAAAVLESPRWGRLVEDLRRSGGRLLAFVPADTPGLERLSRTVGTAVVVGSPAAAASATARLDPSCRIAGIVEPAPAVTRVVLDDEPLDLDPTLSEPPVIRKTRESRRASPVLLLLLIALAAVAGWFIYDQLMAAPQGAGLEEPTAAAPAPARRGDPVETPLPVSVAVEAHQGLESAVARTGSLSRAEPDVSFYLAPVSVNGVLYYRLLAGPVADQEAGARLMERLVEAGHKSAVDSWAVRPTELAFHLGDFDTRQAAATRVERLLAQEIPSYIVPIRHDPGPPRYRVYGGAFESRAEAEVMGQMLEDAGIEAPLVSRTGEPIE